MSPWLSESVPRKSPYFPQIGDMLVYFQQGHQKYLELVKQRNVYEVGDKEQASRFILRTHGCSKNFHNNNKINFFRTVKTSSWPGPRWA